MKTLASFLRIAVVAVLALIVIEKTAGSPGEWAIVSNPVLVLVWLGIILFMIAIEVSVASLQGLLFHTLNEEAKEKYLEAEKNKNEFAWATAIYKKMIGKKAAPTESELVLDHEYDGIRELDNNLPPWWIYSFYATIIFAVIYMARFHVFNGSTQEQEYERAMAIAALEIEEYRRTAKDLVDASTVVILTEPGDLSAGKTIYENTCAACHRMDGGGGIGPNLTDDYWILGGSIGDIFTVISEGGRPGKGMIAWKNDLSPLQIAQVSSYITTLHGTNPPDAKEAEGDLYASEIEIEVENETEVEKSVD